MGLFLYELLVFLDTQSDADTSNTNYYHGYIVLILCHYGKKICLLVLQLNFAVRCLHLNKFILISVGKDVSNICLLKKVSEYDQECYLVSQPLHRNEEIQNTDSDNTIKVEQPALSSSERWLLN